MQNWSTEEDQYLLNLFQDIHVYNRWKEISKKMIHAGFNKTELQCRNRYHNKLNPNLVFDEWSKKEIENIFKFYDEYGSKWNLIETFLPGRTQNNIKNRFFSTLKNLIRKLLKKFTDAPKQKALKYISSRDVTDLYEGRGKFKKFKGLMRKILRKINYQIEFKAINPVISQYTEMLQELMILFCVPDGSSENRKSEMIQPQKTQSVERNQNAQQLYQVNSNLQTTHQICPTEVGSFQIMQMGYLPQWNIQFGVNPNFLMAPQFIPETWVNYPSNLLENQYIQGYNPTFPSFNESP